MTTLPTFSGDTASDEPSAMRRVGRDRLSLALMEVRNRTLKLAAAFEQAGGGRGDLLSDWDPPLWLLGHVGWFQEAWIGRNVHRARGPNMPGGATLLASIEPLADGWYDPARATRAERHQLALPDAQRTRAYLVDTLETTLDLLASADDSDDGLHFYRAALFHEAAHAEHWIEMADAAGLSGVGDAEATSPRAPCDPICVPATRWRLGSDAAGFAPDNEKPAHVIAVPEFEIDAQAVTWAQFAEFVEDGGYDEPRWWTPAGWEWLQPDGRRAPRHVEQLRGRVAVRRFGRVVQAAPSQPATHLTWHEAQAWCRWAGRRMPTEVEWEYAAAMLGSRGMRFGDVWEWTAATYRPYDGFTPDPWNHGIDRGFGRHKVLRGGSFATCAWLRHPRMRAAATPEQDARFTGFRSCSL